jgi:class 3 adenylate cyclase
LTVPERAEELGLDISLSLEEARKAAGKFSAFSSSGTGTTTPNCDAERRVVTVLFVELAGPPKGDGHMAPDQLGYLMRERLTAVMADVEAFGGTVTAVWGTGLVAPFGAPEAHEDDPERALRASFRAIAGAKPSGLARAAPCRSRNRRHRARRHWRWANKTLRGGRRGSGYRRSAQNHGPPGFCSGRAGDTCSSRKPL